MPSSEALLDAYEETVAARDESHSRVTLSDPLGQGVSDQDSPAASRKVANPTP